MLKKVIVYIAVLFIFSASSWSFIPGDVNNSGSITLADIIYLVNYLFKGGPQPYEYYSGDVNGDCLPTLVDVIKLVNYLFKGNMSLVKCPPWTEPENLGPPINGPYLDEAPSLTPDGKMLVFDSNRPGSVNDDIWYSVWDSTQDNWSEAVNAGPNVNSGLSDITPCFSPDGTKLYFAAFGRPGGYGGWDIWVSEWDSFSGTWGIPTNLGSRINTSGTEVEPFVTLDGQKLYFSTGHRLMVSNWTGTEWDSAIDLGDEINTPGTSEQEPTLTEGSDTIYFVRWVVVQQQGKPFIFVSYWSGINWPLGEILDTTTVNLMSYASWGPHITPDGKTLYFTSSRQTTGWQGGSDIWISRKRY